MRYSFRLAELLHYSPDPKKRPGVIKAICNYTGLDRHQVAALLRNEVKNIPLDALSRLCDYLVEHGHAAADQLPAALFAVEAEHFWELLARRHRLELCVGVRRTDQSNTSAVLGDGGIYSSVADLAKWDHALEQHTLVSAEQQQLAWTPPSLPNGARTEYGFGWFVDQDQGTTRLRHHGESRGFTNGIIKYPERRLTVIVLTNRTGGAPWDVAQKVADLYLDPAPTGASPAWRP